MRRGVLARRGAPRKVAITLAGAPQPAAIPKPKRQSKYDRLEFLVSKGLVSWFDAGSARIYQRAMTPRASSAGAVIGKASARISITQGDARRSAAASSLDHRLIAAELRTFLSGQLGSTTVELLDAILIDDHTFQYIAQEGGNMAWNAATLVSYRFRQACVDLTRALSMPRGREIVAKLSE